MTIEHMAENPPGVTETPSSTTLSATPPEKLPIYRAANFDPNRKDYQAKTIGRDVIFTDPITGAEVARMPKAEGGEIDLDPERLSPERGRWLCKEIVRFRTTMTYQERYNEINGPIYAQRLQELQEYVNAWCDIRNDPDPWGSHKAYPRPTAPGQPPEFPPEPQAIQDLKETITQLRAQYQIEGADQPIQPELFPDEPLPADSISDLKTKYDNPNTPQEFHEAERDLQIYFKQAKNNGLLKEVDAVLNSIYREIVRPGISPDQAETLLERRIARLKEFAKVEFREKKIADPNIPQELSDVGDVYIAWANRRLERTIHGQPELDRREGEWFPPPEQVDEGRKETYWEIGNYPKYYHITARTEDQFRIAKETFFQMIRSGSIGKSPSAIFEHVKNFIDVFGSEGGRQVREENIGLDFLTENRLELEALLYVFVGNYSNEVYNPKQKKEVMTAMALDEGPARWVALYRAGEGQIAVFTHMFDNEALMELYHNPVGERGELDIVAGHFLQDQIQEMVIERGMGTVLKDYNPRDEYFNSDNIGAKLDAALDLERIRSELKRIEQDVRSGRIKLGPGETVVSRLSERDQARYNAYKVNLQRLGLAKNDEEFKALYEGFDIGDTHIKNYQRFIEDQNKPPNQRQLPDFNSLTASLSKSIDLGRIQEQLQGFRHAILNGQLKGKLERGQKAVDLLSSKDRQIYQAAYDEAAANYDIAFQMQGVLGEKGRRGRGFLYVDRNPHIQLYYKIADEYRLQRKDPETILNNLAQFSPEQKRSIQIGWMLSKIRDGKRLNSFPQEWQDFYNNLSPKDQHDFVDNIPVYQAENVVQWAVNWTKMKYANVSADVRSQKADEVRARAIKELKEKGFEAQLWDDELGPNGQPKLMTFKRPKGKVSPATGNWEASKDAQGRVIVEPVEATFQIAAQSRDFRNRYTSHTYWFYQGNNRHTILADRIFEAAKRIKDGLSRPEDEDVLATQLLIVDPTLKRVKKFEDVDQQREVTLVAAAVEESYQGRQTTKRELHKVFLPKDGYRGRMRAGYRNEDWAGMDRFTLGFEEFVAQQPARFARRLGAEIALAPFEHDAAAPLWGMHGVSGAIQVMADEIKKFSDQGIVGQFGITKFIDEMDNAVQIFNALVGYTDPQTGEHVFGLYEKPTDNNEKLHQFYGDEEIIATLPNKQIPFLYEFIKTFGRLQRVVKLMRSTYTNVRNSGGALDLEKVEVFNSDGSFNTKIETNEKIVNNTGTARHSQSNFYKAFIKWLLSGEPGGGSDIYPDEAYWNSFLRTKRAYTLGEAVEYDGETIEEWLFGKII